jgi:hypothetical protein
VSVFVGVPCLQENDRYTGYLAGALKHVEAALQGVDHQVFVSPPSRKPSWEGLVECQNQILDEFLKSGSDFLWHVELDVEVPPDSFRKLQSLDVEIACGYVRRHNGGGLILGFLDENMTGWYLPQNAVHGNILSGWVMAGTSCLLLKRRVFESGFRFAYQRNVTPDILFMYQIQSLGFKAKVHGDVLCGHLPEWPLSSIVIQKQKEEFDV